MQAKRRRNTRDQVLLCGRLQLFIKRLHTSAWNDNKIVLKSKNQGNAKDSPCIHPLSSMIGTALRTQAHIGRAKWNTKEIFPTKTVSQEYIEVIWRANINIPNITGTCMAKKLAK